MSTVIGLKEAFLDGAFFASVLGSRGELLSWNKCAVSAADQLVHADQVILREESPIYPIGNSLKKQKPCTVV